MEDSEETSQSLQIDLGPLQSDQQTTSSQDGQGKGDDVIVIDSDDEDDDEENDGEHEVSLVWKSFSVYQLSFSHSLNFPSALCAWPQALYLLPSVLGQSQGFKSLVLLIHQLVSSHSQSVSVGYQVFHLLFRS